MPRIYDIRGRFDCVAFQQAVEEVFRRHEVLRTTYSLRNGEPEQVIHEPRPLEWAGGGEEAAALAFLERMMTAPFDLEREWPARQGLFRVADGHHIFVTVRHHIVTDMWSSAIFEREISAAYSALVSGSEPLPPLPIQYADYAEWQTQQSNATASAALDYWARELDGAPQLLELPRDFHRPPVQSYAGQSIWRGMGNEVSERARALAAELGTSPFRVLLSVFETLLYRYTGRTDFIIGLPVAGRVHPDLEPLHGCFVRTLPLRARIDPEEPFASLVRKNAAKTRSALQNQELPLDQLMNRIGVARDLAHPPLFQVIFSYLNTPRHPMKLDGAEVTMRQISNGTSIADLTVYLDDSRQEMTAQFESCAALFEPERMQRMASHFQTLLASAGAAPETPLKRLDMLGAAEHAALLSRQPAPSPVPGESMTGGLARMAAEHPDRMAIRFGSRTVTFGELAGMAGKVRDWLWASGIREEDRVALSMERSPEMVATLIGIHQCGAAYVPLDPALPRARAEYILADSGAAKVVTDADWPAIAAMPEPSRFVGTPNGAPGGPAYVIYTSGSTGRPKGVAIPRRALLNVAESFRIDPGFRGSDTLLAVTTLSFDIAALEIFLPLWAGGTIALATREQAADGARLAALIESSGATVMQATPSAWRMLIDSGWRGSPDLRAWCGGEALRRDLADELLPKVAELWNVYGPTETTIWSTYSRVSAGAGDPPIGRAIANTTLHVLDSEGEPVPDGVPGELWIGGMGLATGYVNLPELTASKFEERNGERLYRTGDLVRWNSRGELVYERRLDTQVKIRGHRIELGEIQAVLSRHQGVSQCVAAVREDRAAGPRLVAYYVEAAGAAPGSGDLRCHCEEHLPGYMVPSAFVRLDAIPLNHSGKIDVKNLPAPMKPAKPEVETGGNLIEERLREIWRRVLGLESIPPGANFFELGGHSLLAAAHFAAVAEQFGVEIPLVNLFQHPTVEGLAGLIARRDGMLAWTSLVPIKPEGSLRPLFFASRLHSLSGRLLVPYLDPEQPIYGLEPPGMDGGETIGTVEALAAHYVRAIKTVQPGGPYLLCGHSFGGFVAYEMARQLEEAGERGNTVVILDSSPYILPRHREVVPRIRMGARKAGYHLRLAIFAAGAVWDPSRRGYVADLAARSRRRIEEVMDDLRREDTAFDAGVRRVGEAQTHAYHAYRPGTYGGAIVLVRSQRHGPRFDPRGGWQDLVAGPIVVHETKGGHISMLREPHVQETGRIIRHACQRMVSR